MKELEKEHGIDKYMDVSADRRMKEYKMERGNFVFPKQRINEFKDRLDGSKFNEMFNKEIEENKSYDIVKYKGDSLMAVGNFVTLDQFGRLYINGGNEKIFNNNFWAYQRLFIE